MVVRSPNGITHDLLQFYRRTMPDVQVSMDVVAGSDEVATELQNGRAELGFGQSGSLYAAFRTGLPGSVPFSNLRAIAVIGRSSIWLAVPKGSPITTIAGLRGKRIGGVREDATMSYVQMILRAYGLQDMDVETVALSASERFAGLEDRSLDAAVFSGTMTPDFADQQRRLGVRPLEIESHAITHLLTRYPFMTPELIPQHAFHELESSVQTIALDYVVASRADLDEGFVYELTRGFVGQFEAFARRNPRDLLADPEQAPATPIPLHAGAERYYREQEVLR